MTFSFYLLHMFWKFCKGLVTRVEYSQNIPNYLILRIFLKRFSRVTFPKHILKTFWKCSQNAPNNILKSNQFDFKKIASMCFQFKNKRMFTNLMVFYCYVTFKPHANSLFSESWIQATERKFSKHENVVIMNMPVMLFIYLLFIG